MLTLRVSDSRMPAHVLSGRSTYDGSLPNETTQLSENKFSITNQSEIRRDLIREFLENLDKPAIAPLKIAIPPISRIIDCQPDSIDRKSAFFVLNQTTNTKISDLIGLKKLHKEKLGRLYTYLFVGTGILNTVVTSASCITCLFTCSSVANFAISCGLFCVSPIAISAVLTSCVSLGVGCGAKTYSYKQLQKNDISKIKKTLSDLMKILDQIDEIEISNENYPDQFLSTLKIKSLRDPIFIKNYNFPVSSREFYKCVEEGSLFPYKTRADLSHLKKPDDYSIKQQAQLKSLQTAFDIFDNQPLKICKDYLNGLSEECRFW